MYHNKYLKYKAKYLALQQTLQTGGAPFKIGIANDPYEPRREPYEEFITSELNKLIKTDEKFGDVEFETVDLSGDSQKIFDELPRRNLNMLIMLNHIGVRPGVGRDQVLLMENIRLNAKIQNVILLFVTLGGADCRKRIINEFSGLGGKILPGSPDEEDVSLSLCLSSKNPLALGNIDEDPNKFNIEKLKRLITKIRDASSAPKAAPPSAAPTQPKPVAPAKAQAEAAAKAQAEAAPKAQAEAAAKAQAEAAAKASTAAKPAEPAPIDVDLTKIIDEIDRIIKTYVVGRRGSYNLKYDMQTERDKATINELISKSNECLVIRTGGDPNIKKFAYRFLQITKRKFLNDDADRVSDNNFVIFVNKEGWDKTFKNKYFDEANTTEDLPLYNIARGISSEVGMPEQYAKAGDAIIAQIKKDYETYMSSGVMRFVKGIRIEGDRVIVPGEEPTPAQLVSRLLGTLISDDIRQAKEEAAAKAAQADAERKAKEEADKRKTDEEAEQARRQAEKERAEAAAKAQAEAAAKAQAEAAAKEAGRKAAEARKAAEEAERTKAETAVPPTQTAPAKKPESFEEAIEALGPDIVTRMQKNADFWLVLVDEIKELQRRNPNNMYYFIHLNRKEKNITGVFVGDSSDRSSIVEIVFLPGQEAWTGRRGERYGDPFELIEHLVKRNAAKGRKVLIVPDSLSADGSIKSREAEQKEAARKAEQTKAEQARQQEQDREKAEQEVRAKQQAAKAARQKAKQEAEQEAKQKAEQEARQKAEQEAAARQKAEQEARQTKAAEDRARQAAADAEQARRQAEAAAAAAKLAEAKTKEEQEAARKAADEAARKAADEAARKAADEAARKADIFARQVAFLKAAEEKSRLEIAEEIRKADEAARKTDEEKRKAEADRQAEAKRKADEEARKAAEDKRRADEAVKHEADRQAAENKRKADEAARKTDADRRAEAARKLASLSTATSVPADLAAAKRKAAEDKIEAVKMAFFAVRVGTEQDRKKAGKR